MNRILVIAVFLFSWAFASCGWSSDACTVQVIQTAASVQVSDGTSFDTESFFQSADTNAIKHIRDDDQIVAVEGPLAWVSRGVRFEPGDDRLKNFALGHQFHALLLGFETIIENAKPATGLSFQSGLRQGMGGDFPYGGKVFLIQGDDSQRPQGLLFEFPEMPPIEAVYSDWREHQGRLLPFHIQIDDGTDEFEYSYSRVDIMRRPSTWFLDAVPAPAIDELVAYREEKRALAAACESQVEPRHG